MFAKLLKVNQYQNNSVLRWMIIIILINLIIGLAGVEDLIKELSKVDIEVLVVLASIALFLMIVKGIGLVQTVVTSALSIKEFFQTYTEKIQLSYDKLETAMDRTITVSDRQTDVLFQHISNLERVERSTSNSEQALKALPGFISGEVASVSAKLDTINKHLEIIGKDIKDLNARGLTELHKIDERLSTIETKNTEEHINAALKKTETKVVEILQTIRGENA